MQFIGKLIGFFIGYKLSGSFFGGLLGAFIGHLVDKKRYENADVSSSIFGQKLTRQSVFMQTTFAVFGHIAKAKGRVTEEDIHLARTLMARLNLDSANKKIAQNAFILGKESDFPLRTVIQEFREICGQRSDLLRFFIEVQMQAAVQDGTLDANEQRILLTIAEVMGLSRVQFDQMLSMVMAAQQFQSENFYRYQQNQSYQDSHQRSQQQSYRGSRQSSQTPSIEAAYQVLGVTAADDQNTVKRAYRKLMNEHHPDKLASKGLPDEMMDLAKEKAQQIQAAYDLICKAKNWK